MASKMQIYGTDPYAGGVTYLSSMPAIAWGHITFGVGDTPTVDNSFGINVGGIDLDDGFSMTVPLELTTANVWPVAAVFPRHYATDPLYIGYVKETTATSFRLEMADYATGGPVDMKISVGSFDFIVFGRPA